ncbi:hypothetical protein GOODEAATRI_034248, partial [Goodea atripinnis]
RLFVFGTCSKWPLSAYPWTNSQYRVLDQLGPGRSATLFSFPSCSLAAWTFRFLLVQTAAEAPGRSALSVRVESAVRRRGQAGAARQPMVQADRTDCLWTKLSGDAAL